MSNRVAHGGEAGHHALPFTVQYSVRTPPIEPVHLVDKIIAFSRGPEYHTVGDRVDAPQCVNLTVLQGSFDLSRSIVAQLLQFKSRRDY